MGLSITNNVASLTAQNNLSRSSSMLAKSLERLSSGLKINRGADGPAALVISEQQRAQIAGLQTAIDNTTKAVSMVQTAEGALNEVNSLLIKIRSLALDAANSGINDAPALDADQAEVDKALETIDRIASNTQFGSKKLLDGTFSGIFQIGANSGQTASLDIAGAASSDLGVDGIDVTTDSGAAAALTAVDAAINQVSTQRGDLGAFQSNTLESTANNLRSALENTTSAESVIRDTDFAAETANFTKSQVLMQVGTTVLQNANATSQLVLNLLK